MIIVYSSDNTKYEDDLPKNTVYKILKRKQSINPIDQAWMESLLK